MEEGYLPRPSSRWPKRAGFELAASARSTPTRRTPRDHLEGVWTLPPARARRNRPREVRGHRRERPHDAAVPQTGCLIGCLTGYGTGATLRRSSRHRRRNYRCSSLSTSPTACSANSPTAARRHGARWPGSGCRPDVYAAGRLDYDSEGLLLLTDDGALAHRLTDPRHKQPKTYWVQVEGDRRRRSRSQHCARACTLNDGPTLPGARPSRSTAPALWPRDPPVRFRKTVPDAWLEADHQRRPQPPGAAHDGGGRPADAAAGARGGGWPSSR